MEPFIETLTLNVLTVGLKFFFRQWCEVKTYDKTTTLNQEYFYSLLLPIHYILEKNRSTQNFIFRKITIPQCKNKSKSPAFKIVLNEYQNEWKSSKNENTHLLADGQLCNVLKSNISGASEQNSIAPFLRNNGNF